MFRKGTEVTTSILTRFFQTIYRTINGLSNRQLNQMTSGQMIFDDTQDSVRIIADPLNVWSTQYFDNRLLIYNEAKGTTIDIFQYYENKLGRL